MEIRHTGEAGSRLFFGWASTAGVCPGQPCHLMCNVQNQARPCHPVGHTRTTFDLLGQYFEKAWEAMRVSAGLLVPTGTQGLLSGLWRADRPILGQSAIFPS